MKSDINQVLVDGYAQLLDNLSPGSKLDLISHLTKSVKTDLASKRKSFYKAFGAWSSKKTSEQIITEIRKSRSFNRNIESL